MGMAEGGWLITSLSLFALLRDAVFTFVLILAVRVALREGAAGLMRRLVTVLKILPGVEEFICWILRREVRGFLKQIGHGSGSEAGGKHGLVIPEKGRVQVVFWNANHFRGGAV